MTDKFYNLRLDPETMGRIDRLADLRGQTKLVVITRAIEKELDRAKELQEVKTK